MLYLCVFCFKSDVRAIWFWICFSRASLSLFVVWSVPWIVVFTVLSVGFPYFTVVQLMCSLSGWLHLSYTFGVCSLELRMLHYFKKTCLIVFHLSLSASICGQVPVENRSYSWSDYLNCENNLIIWCHSKVPVIVFESNSGKEVVFLSKLRITYCSSLPIFIFFEAKQLELMPRWSGSPHTGSDCRKGVCLPRSIMKYKRFW